MEKTKANICEIVEIYTKKYEDVFPMLPTFVETTWTLLTSTGLQPKYDIVCTSSGIMLMAACEQGNVAINLRGQSPKACPPLRIRIHPPPNRRKNNHPKHDNAKYPQPLHIPHLLPPLFSY